MEIEICQQSLQLNPDKTILWKDKSILFISDVHLGKAMHFRKAGIPIPKEAFNTHLNTLASTFEQHAVSEVFFLGDLFHSNHNSEWELFCDFLKSEFSYFNFNLIVGNHDILSYWDYDKAGIRVFKNKEKLGPFLLSHHPVKNYDGKEFLISGHVHPGVKLKGKGMQSLRLPCFYFEKNQAIMPAYGKLTGLHIIKPKKEDQVFVIANDKVLKV